MLIQKDLQPASMQPLRHDDRQGHSGYRDTTTQTLCDLSTVCYLVTDTTTDI